MSYPDAPDEDGPPGRPTRAARPAWDAATYGRPDDTRRTRPSAEPPPPPPPPPSRYRDTGGSAYPEETFPGGDPYDPPGYGSQSGYGSTGAYGSGSPLSQAPPPEPYGVRYPGGGEASAYADEPHGDEPGRRRTATGQRVIDPAGRPFPEPEPAHFPGGGPPAGPEPVHPVVRAGAGRAGRNLPAAIGVGLLLGGTVLASLLFWRPAFLGVIAVAVGVGSWELVRAIRTSGAYPPFVPLLAGGLLMVGLAWWGQGDALTFGLVVTVLAAMVWRLADGAGGYARDVTAATLIATYLPFLGGFVALLALPPDGHLRVVAMIAGVVLTDTGGYIAGVLFGRHPMAPTVSPKKSWEGLAGSMVAGAVGGAVLLSVMFGVAVWWGALFGIAVSTAAVVGDLGESMLKRDLGVKDMSNLLPGHGGLMDRLDSILLAAPTAYALLMVLAPPG
jgi:phosphatidate cytidylyltransferase